MVVASLLDTLAKIGAVGGIIAFLGVGLMILLLASQARQIKDMQDWIDAEPDRQAETAQRVIAEVQRRIAAARERRAAAQSGQPLPPARPIPPAPGTLGATPEAQATAAAIRTTDSVSAPLDTPAPGEEGAPHFAPLTPAGSEGTEGSVPPPIADVLGQETQPSDPVDAPYEPPYDEYQSPIPGDPDFGEIPAFDLYDDEPHERGGNRVLFAVGAATLLAGIVLFGVLLFSGGDDKAANSNASGDTAAQEEPAASTPDPASVTVSVLNTTATTGLARDLSEGLKSAGYNVETPASLSPARQNSVVEYQDGHEADAAAVAKELNLSASSIAPMEQDVASAGSPNADVIVVVGEDLAASGTTSGTTAGTTE